MKAMQDGEYEVSLRPCRWICSAMIAAGFALAVLIVALCMYPEAAGGHAGAMGLLAVMCTLMTAAWVTAFLMETLLLGRRPIPAPAAAEPVIDTVPVTVSKNITIGQLHHIGQRPYQEDSSGVTVLPDGIFAVVADGMGGLAGGDKVSQKIVYTMLELSDLLPEGRMDGALESMVLRTNEAVNEMLGAEGLYRSGSTLVSVLIRQGCLHWVSVGDSHIYFFRDGKLVRLNEEHNREQELRLMAEKGEIPYDMVWNAPDRKGLTSFIGMGRLKYMERSTQSIPLCAGDRIALMTDGVFGTLPDDTIAAVLQEKSNVQEAAAELERLVLQAENPRQDNFTAVILGI